MVYVIKPGDVAKSFIKAVTAEIDNDNWTCEAILSRLKPAERQLLDEVQPKIDAATPEASTKLAETLTRAMRRAGMPDKVIGQKFIRKEIRTSANKAAFKEIAPCFSRTF